MQVDGHSPCRGCGELHPKLLLSRVGGLCDGCAKAVSRELASRLEVQDGGRRYLIPIPPRASRHGGGSPDTRRAARAAAAAAMRRLKQVHPATYAILLADERERRGLAAVDVRQPVVSEAALDADLATLEV